MLRRFALILALASPAAAQEWVALDDAGIAAALTDARVAYDGAWQEFYASGRTLYNAGRDSWGYWAPRGGRYCSQWPPADGWACYDVERAGDRVRFIGDSGEITEGLIE